MDVCYPPRKWPLHVCALVRRVVGERDGTLFTRVLKIQIATQGGIINLRLLGT